MKCEEADGRHISWWQEVNKDEALKNIREEEEGVGGRRRPVEGGSG